MQYLLGIMMFLTALFLILLVLIQRGRGGGLAGAFGGAGGQSAFGTKAGDMFTKITIGTAAVWIMLNAASVRLLNSPKASVLGSGRTTSSGSQTGSSVDSEFSLDGGLGGLDGGGFGSSDLNSESDRPETDGPETDGSETDTGPDAETDTTSTDDQPDGGAATSDDDTSAAETPATTPPATDPAPGE